MAWPIQVARKAPTMPSTVVRMNPLGLFGPGDSSRARIPATKPTIMMCSIAVVLSWKKQRFRGSSGPKSKPARKFVLGRQPPVRRQVVDDIGQLLAQPREQFVARQAALRHQAVDLIGAERAGEIAGRDLLVGAVADP